MSNDTMEVHIAASAIKDHVPQGAPLSDRVFFAMRYAIEHEASVFWMSGRVDDDLILRAALAAVLLSGSPADEDIIRRSLQPLKMLSAAMQGIPVDFSAMETGDDLLPLMKLFREAKDASSKGRGDGNG